MKTSTTTNSGRERARTRARARARERVPKREGCIARTAVTREMHHGIAVYKHVSMLQMEPHKCRDSQSKFEFEIAE